jgi:exoribonuclease II
LETIPEDSEFIPWWVGLSREEIHFRLMETERNSKKVMEFLKQQDQQEDLCPCCIIS